MKMNSLFINGKQYILTSIIFLILGISNIAYSQINQNMVNSDFYNSFKRIKYHDLPDEIRKIMKDSECGEIDAYPSQSNDYKTNYDEGYAIDLNDDKILEYIFCCTAPPHGPCSGKIYSFIEGKWEAILDYFPVFEGCKPEVAIKVLASKTGMYHDLLRTDILSTRNVTMKLIEDKYYSIYFPDEVVKNLLSFMEHYSKSIDSCYFGFSNNANKILKTNYSSCNENSKYLYALDSEIEANEVKKILISKGMHFITNYSKGQIIFCFTNSPK